MSTVDYGEISAENYEIPFQVKYENIEIKDNFYYVNAKSRVFIYPTSKEEKNEEIYLYLGGMTKYGTPERKHSLNIIQVGNKTIDVLDHELSKGNGINIEDYLIHANYRYNISEKIEISFNHEDIFELQELKLFLYAPDTEAIRQLNGSQIIEMEESRGDIDGYVETDRNGMLFLGIPYSEGWNAWIDGKKTEICKANVGFMAIPLRKGEHTIKLRYVTPGIRVGSFLSIICFVGIFIYGVCGRKKCINC